MQITFIDYSVAIQLAGDSDLQNASDMEPSLYSRFLMGKKRRPPGFLTHTKMHRLRTGRRGATVTSAQLLSATALGRARDS